MNFFGIFADAKRGGCPIVCRTRLILAAGVLSVSLLAFGCSAEKADTSGDQSGAEKTASQSEESNGQTAQAKQAAPQVNVIAVATTKEKFVREWPAETKSGESVNICARVEGTLEAFNFREGMGVSAGQVLFTIDDAPYQAVLLESKAAVAQARADLEYAKAQVNVRKVKADLVSARVDLARTQQDVDRYKPLARNGVIPTQTLDNAVSARDVAKARVDATTATLVNTELSDKANIEVAAATLQAAQAKVTQAELNIGYCVIKSPVNGIIGKLNVDPGNLVGQMGNSQPLVTISKLDPIYVNYSISETEYLWMMEHRGKGGADFQLLLSDGTTYPYKGKFGMLDRTLSADSGTMGVRIIFPNPDRLLREGQFGRLRLTSHATEDVITVPQRAILSAQSDRSVYVVGPNNIVESRNVKLGDELGENVIVRSGLKVGEHVIVDGLQKVRPGAPCDPAIQGNAPAVEAGEASQK